MKKIELKGIVFIFSTMLLASGITNAAITIPSCEKLKDFPLHNLGSLIAYKKHNVILQEYFGIPLSSWLSEDMDTFVSTFVSCRTKDESFFYKYEKNYFPRAVKEQADNLQSELERASIELNTNEAAHKLQKEAEILTEQAKKLTITGNGLTRLSAIRDEADALQKKYNNNAGVFTDIMSQVDNALIQFKVAKSDKDFIDELKSEQAKNDLAKQTLFASDAKEAQILLKKHGKIGPPPDFLVSQFKTYAGVAASGEMGTIIQFYDLLDGKKKWDKRGDIWVLTQKRTDHLTGKKHEMLYAFHDLRSSEGFTWLNRLLIDKKEYPASELYNLVLRIVFKP